jgi:hypothetical protein
MLNSTNRYMKLAHLLNRHSQLPFSVQSEFHSSSVYVCLYDRLKISLGPILLFGTSRGIQYNSLRLEEALTNCI